MTKEELAAKLNDREYTKEITKEEERLAAQNEMMDKDMREKAERFRKWMKGER